MASWNRCSVFCGHPRWANNARSIPSIPNEYFLGFSRSKGQWGTGVVAAEGLRVGSAVTLRFGFAVIVGRSDCTTNYQSGDKPTVSWTYQCAAVCQLRPPIEGRQSCLEADNGPDEHTRSCGKNLTSTFRRTQTSSRTSQIDSREIHRHTNPRLRTLRDSHRWHRATISRTPHR